MAALSDYLESGILNHIFRNTAFARPSTIAIALTSSVALDSQDGTNIPELPTGVNGNLTNYNRIDLGSPATIGDTKWNPVGTDATTAYALSGTKVADNKIGYFYPLYLDEVRALDVADGGSITGVEFVEFPSVSFYSPTSSFQNGVTTPATSEVTYEGNGFIKNASQFVFETALTEWGWVSGIAILDSATVGQGNLLMYAELSNPRYIYIGDNVRFDANSLEISLT